jgi:hypothetical protein
MELVLGGDAFVRTPMGAAQARGARPVVPVPQEEADAALVPEEP